MTLEQYLRGQTCEWPRWFGLLLAYREAHGDCRVPNKHKTAEGLALGRWVNEQRTTYSRGELSAARVARLEAVDGWV